MGETVSQSLIKEHTNCQYASQLLRSGLAVDEAGYPLEDLFP